MPNNAGFVPKVIWPRHWDDHNVNLNFRDNALKCTFSPILIKKEINSHLGKKIIFPLLFWWEKEGRRNGPPHVTLKYVLNPSHLVFYARPSPWIEENSYSTWAAVAAAAAAASIPLSPSWAMLLLSCIICIDLISTSDSMQQSWSSHAAANSK